MASFLYPLPREYYDQTTSDTAATVYYSRSYHGAHTYTTSKGTPHGTGKLDLNCKNGTPVRAMTDGIVCRTRKDNSAENPYSSIWILVQGDVSIDGISYHVDNKGYVGEGGVVGGTLVIRYYHVGQLQFKLGDNVKQGDIIAYVGDPCVTSGTHLHLDFQCSGGVLMPAYGPLKNAPDPDTISGYTPEQIAGLKRWYRDDKHPGRCWEVIISEAVWKDAGGGAYNGDVDTFKRRLEEFNKKYGYSMGGSITTSYAGATIKLYNQLIANGANSGAACCILGNAYEENILNCVNKSTQEINWGKAKAVGGSGYDCGIWAFHSGGDAFNDIVLRKIFPPESLSTWGFTQEQVNAGQEDVQTAYIAAIMNQSEKIKTNGVSRYKMYVRSNISTITDPIMRRPCSGNIELQKKYVNGNYNDFFTSDIDLGTGALLMERLFEGSAQHQKSLIRRVGTAWAMGYIFMNLNL